MPNSVPFCLGSLDLSSACLNSTTILPRHQFLLPLPVYVILCLCLTSKSFLRHADFFAFSSYFPILGDREECPRKSVLKELPALLCSFFSKDYSQGGLIWQFSKQLEFCSLKFRVLTLFFGRPIFLNIANSTRPFLLQPKVSSILTSFLSSSALVISGSSNTYLLVDLSNSWMSKLLPAHSLSLWNCLQPAIFHFQETSGCLKSSIKRMDQEPASTVLVIESRRPHCTASP